MSGAAAGGRLADFCAVAIMAKAPRIGRVKTRLAPPLSAAGAAELGASFILDTAGKIIAAARSAPIHGHVAYSPPDAAAEFRALLPPAIGLLPSRRAGLGNSLADAVRDLFAAGYGSACLVNADSPTLPVSLLLAAAAALREPGDRVVLGPAEDGGYYCIGLKTLHPRLFEDIDWSTARVLAQTLDRAREIGLPAVLLAPWYDVDDPPSLARLIGDLFGNDCDGARPGDAAPHTAAALRRLGIAGERGPVGSTDP